MRYSIKCFHHAYEKCKAEQEVERAIRTRILAWSGVPRHHRRAMVKRVSQEEIDRHLNRGIGKVELERHPDPTRVSRGAPKGKASPEKGKSAPRPVFARPIGFRLLIRAFLLIECAKSWWILATWGSEFFFKDWPTSLAFALNRTWA